MLRLVFRKQLPLTLIMKQLYWRLNTFRYFVVLTLAKFEFYSIRYVSHAKISIFIYTSDFCCSCIQWSRSTLVE